MFIEIECLSLNNSRDEVKFSEQIILDLYYIENMSLRLDIEIMLKTFPIVLFGKGGL